MNTYFTYAVLQYRHSLVFDEALNVGILFYFPQDQKLTFVSGNTSRAKHLYPEFDTVLINGYLKAIAVRATQGGLNPTESISITKGFNDYIHENIWSEDAAGLVFQQAKEVVNVFGSSNDAISNYTKLLLPGLLIEKHSLAKHNEGFILRKFTESIFNQHKDLERKFKKNEEVKTSHLNLKFELAWQNGSMNLVKALSFDLADGHNIQNKAATYLGYLAQLEDYAKKRNARFDFLISGPQDGSLQKEYQNALDTLDFAKNTPKKLITEDKWEGYANQTVEDLLNH